MWFGRKGLRQRGGEPGFAYPGLTGQQHYLAFAGFDFRPASQQQVKLFVSADQCRQAASVHRLKAARDRTRPQHRENWHRTSDPLELLGSKVPQLKEIAEKLARGLGNDDCVGLGDGL